MAYDKVVDSAALDAVFTGIADAIRKKTGTTGAIASTDMAAAILGIQNEGGDSGGGDLADTLKAIVDGTGGDIRLPDGITKIRDSCFYLFTKLAITQLPDTVETIEQYAFYGCQNIGLEKLPSTLKTIGSTAFRNCRAMSIKEIPASVESIGTNAFAQCSALTDITFRGVPTSLASTAFYTCTNLKTLNVPWAEGAVAGAPWGASGATINYNYTGG